MERFVVEPWWLMFQFSDNDEGHEKLLQAVKTLDKNRRSALFYVCSLLPQHFVLHLK